MKDNSEGRQLNFDFSNEVIGNRERRIGILQLVYKADCESIVERNSSYMHMSAKVLENLLKTRITES